MKRPSTWEIRSQIERAGEVIRKLTAAGNASKAEAWQQRLAELERDLAVAEAAEVAIDPEFKHLNIKRLVRLTMGLEIDGDGLMAERELLRRLQAQPPDGRLPGPAKLVLLKNGRLEFSSLTPWMPAVGQFLAYDVGYYD